VRTIPLGPVVGVVAQVVFLAALASSAGLGTAGWLVGVATGVLTNALLVRALHTSGAQALGPANVVTLVRAVLVGAVAALVADSMTRPVPLRVLVAVAAVALLLDAVDGLVARRTGSVSRLGWRFDGEVDAFLILVLSVHVARTTLPAVLVMGLARYAFLAAGWVLPWLRATLPPRYWRKVVAAVQGVALITAAAGVLSPPWTVALLLASLALLVESFGRDVWWLWRRRQLARELSPDGGPGSDRTPRGTGPGTHPSARPEHLSTG